MYSSWSTYILIYILHLYFKLHSDWKIFSFKFSMNMRKRLYTKKNKRPSNIQVKIISCKTVFSTCPLARFLESPCSQSCHSNCHLHDLVIHFFKQNKGNYYMPV